MLTTKNSENREKAIAYIRVSSQRQVDEGVSLDAQKRRILDYAWFKGMKKKLGKWVGIHKGSP